MVKLYDCDCEWEPDKDVKIGKGYKLVKMCSYHKQLMLEEQQREEEFNKQLEQENTIRQKLREIALQKIEEEKLFLK